MDVKKFINGKGAPWLITFLLCLIGFWQPITYMRGQVRQLSDSLSTRTRERDSINSELKSALLRESHVERNYYASLYQRQQELEKLVKSVAVVTLRNQKSNIQVLAKTTSPQAGITIPLPASLSRPTPLVVVKSDTVCFDSTTVASIYTQMLELQALRRHDTISIKAYETLKLDQEIERQSNGLFVQRVADIAWCQRIFCGTKRKLRREVKAYKSRPPTVTSSM